MSNFVVRGEYNNYILRYSQEGQGLFLNGSQEEIKLNRDSVKDYKILHTEYRMNMTNIVIRTLIASQLVGFLGLLAGFTAPKSEVDYHYVSIEYNDNKHSLLKMTENMYKKFILEVY